MNSWRKKARIVRVEWDHVDTCHWPVLHTSLNFNFIHLVFLNIYFFLAFFHERDFIFKFPRYRTSATRLISKARLGIVVIHIQVHFIYSGFDFKFGGSCSLCCDARLNESFASGWEFQFLEVPHCCRDRCERFCGFLRFWKFFCTCEGKWL